MLRHIAKTPTVHWSVDATSHLHMVVEHFADGLSKVYADKSTRKKQIYISDVTLRQVSRKRLLLKRFSDFLVPLKGQLWGYLSVYGVT